MNLEFIKKELSRAQDAELESEEQLRQLPGLLQKTYGPNPPMNASDCAKVIGSALALNQRLRERAESLSRELERAVRIAEHEASQRAKQIK